MVMTTAISQIFLLNPKIPETRELFPGLVVTTFIVNEEYLHYNAALHSKVVFPQLDADKQHCIFW